MAEDGVYGVEVEENKNRLTIFHRLENFEKRKKKKKKKKTVFWAKHPIEDHCLLEHIRTYDPLNKYGQGSLIEPFKPTNIQVFAKQIK